MRNLRVLQVVVLLAVGQLYSQNLTDSLVAWYPFSGNAVDASGKGNNGTVSGAVLTTDRFGNENSAYLFNKSINSYIAFPSFTGFSTKQFTISFWVKKPSPTFSNFETIIGTNRFRLQTYCDTALSWDWTLRVQGLDPTFNQPNTKGFYGLAWHHIVCVKNGDSTCTYVDGVKSTLSGICHDTVNVTAMNIGRDGLSTIGAVDYFAGCLDDIKIYKRVLSSAEITSLYSEPANNLIAWYPFNGNANDSTIYKNNGTVTGATLTTDRFGNANKAYSFDGVDDFIDFGTNPIFGLPNNAVLSFSLWQKISTTDFVQLTKYYNGSTTNSNYALIGGVVATGNGTNTSSYSFGTDGTWQHIVVIFDNAKDSVFIYKNAVLVKKDPLAYATVTSTIPLYLGKIVGNPGVENNHCSKGFVDDLRIYNKAISQSEITVLFNEGIIPNNAPGFVSTPDTNATEDIAWSYAITAVDVDAGDTVTLSLPTNPTGMTLSGTTLSWTPINSNVGINNVTVRATDNHGAFSEQVFRLRVVNVNDSPSITSAAPTAAVQSQLFSYQAQASDPDVGDVHTWMLTTAPTGMTVSSTGLLSWTPTTAQVGSNSVVLQVKDAANVTAQQSFTITVTNVNDAPVITDPAAQTATEDVLFTLNLAATDPDGNQVFWFKVQGPDSLKINQNTGVLTWTPRQDKADSTVQIKVRATDAVLSDTTTFNITVTAVNDAPEITTIIPNTFKLDSLYSIPLTATDEEGNTITWTVTKKPSTMNIVSNTLVWVPIKAGLDTIVLVASDGSKADTLTSFVQVLDLSVGTRPSTRSIPSMLSLSSTSKHGSASLTVGLPAGVNNGTVRIFNISGRLVESHNISGSGWHTVYLPNRSTGVLLARISAGGKTVEKRLLVGK